MLSILPVVFLAVGILAIGHSKRRWLTMAYAVGSFVGSFLVVLLCQAVIVGTSPPVNPYTEPSRASIPFAVAVIVFGSVAKAHAARIKSK